MLWIILGTIGIVLAMVGVGLLIDRRFALLPRPEDLRALDAPPPPPPPPPPGETPATALRGPPAAPRCCGAPMVEVGTEPLRYDGRALTVVRLRCATCGATRSLYHA